MIRYIRSDLALSGSKLINTIGKSLYNHIESAFEYRKSANMYDVYFTIYYQIIEELRDIDDTEVHEMIVNINITTYDNYIRVNIYTNENPNQLTSFDKYDIKRYDSIDSIVQSIYQNTLKRLNKFFYLYDFIF